MYSLFGIEGNILGVVAFVIALLLSLAITPGVRILAERLGVMDIPEDSRRMHTRPIPCMGGLAIFIVLFLTAFIFGVREQSLLPLMGGGVLLLVMGIADDVRAIPPGVKLIVQLIASVVYIMFSNIHINIIFTILAVLWVVGITNAVNLTDGVDGLASGLCTVAAIILGIIGLLHGDVSTFLWMCIMAGTCLGFIRNNWHPAKIFLGDSGSNLLGYVFACVSIQSMSITEPNKLIGFILIISVPIADTAYAIVRRVARGQNPLLPDRGHIHHKLADSGMSQPKLVLVLVGIQLVTGIIGLIITL